MIIKRIILHNWKNFQHADIKLSERIFIIGPNASGKSNFLDAIRFLRDISKQAGGLQSAVENRGGIKRIRCLAARRQSNISIEVHLGESDLDNPKWKYHINFKNTGGGVIKNEAEIIDEKVWSRDSNKWILLRTAEKEDDKETLKYTHLEQITANKNFREIYAFFQQLQYLNVVPQLVREASTYTISKNKEDFFGRNFIERISKINERIKISYLNKINNVLKLAVPQLEELNLIKDESGVPHLEAKYIHWRARGGKQTEEQFSDGTLRLIGFLWALLDGNGTILLEEPEINLHTEIIKQFPEFISKIQRDKKQLRQVIITTHSYDLLNNEGIGTEEVLLLKNTREGTTIKRIDEIDEIKTIIDAGISIAEATIAGSAPKNIKNISQLNFFE